MIKTILWDVDGTLLNFSKSEKFCILRCLEEIGFYDCDDEMISRYAKINTSYWEALERGELTKQEVLVGRFRTFFRQEEIPCSDVEAFNLSYQKKLGEVYFENDDARNLCKNLQGKVKQYVVTNGTALAQRKKLENSSLGDYMDGVFISDEIGVEKPGIGFFDHVFRVLGHVDRREVMIVGDSLTSDMKGGNVAGILCCWYNPQKKENRSEVRIDYEIQNLWDVLPILGL